MEQFSALVVQWIEQVRPKDKNVGSISCREHACCALDVRYPDFKRSRKIHIDNYLESEF